MAEPYKKIGRGGAGNFWTKQDFEAASKTNDVEANDTATPTADLKHAIAAPLPPPEYQHTGRGGAGNWVKPSELEAQGLSQASTSTSSLAGDEPTSITSSTASPPGSSGVGVSKRVLGGGSSRPAFRSGRGGAGNWIDPVAEENARREEEERVKEEMERRVQEDVEKGLARPGKAYGGVGGAWEMGSMK